ncbi:MAG TPA: SRPBCC domain-containing protein [Gemmatimonadaceae bacterium]
MTLEHTLERTLTILAKRETVFRFFTDTPRWEKWWGKGSTVDPRPGGKVRILYPGAIEVTGEVLEVSEPERISFTYGFTSGSPIPPGSSRVTISLAEQGSATKLTLVHEFSDAAVRDDHIQGWRYQLSLFSNIVSDEVNVGVAEFVDAWNESWANPDAGEREKTFRRIATPAVQFRDKYSTLDGIDDVLAHVTAAQRFMPGVRLERQGDVRQCQGRAYCNWNASANGKPIGSGSTFFVLDADGRIEAATGFWS